MWFCVGRTVTSRIALTLSYSYDDDARNRLISGIFWCSPGDQLSRTDSKPGWNHTAEFRKEREPICPPQANQIDDDVLIGLCQDLQHFFGAGTAFSGPDHDGEL